MFDDIYTGEGSYGRPVARVTDKVGAAPLHVRDSYAVEGKNTGRVVGGGLAAGAGIAALWIFPPAGAIATICAVGAVACGAAYGYFKGGAVGARIGRTIPKDPDKTPVANARDGIGDVTVAAQTGGGGEVTRGAANTYVERQPAAGVANDTTRQTLQEGASRTIVSNVPLSSVGNATRENGRIATGGSRTVVGGTTATEAAMDAEDRAFDASIAADEKLAGKFGTAGLILGALPAGIAGATGGLARGALGAAPSLLRAASVRTAGFLGGVGLYGGGAGAVSVAGEKERELVTSGLTLAGVDPARASAIGEAAELGTTTVALPLCLACAGRGLAKGKGTAEPGAPGAPEAAPEAPAGAPETAPEAPAAAPEAAPEAPAAAPEAAPEAPAPAPEAAPEAPAPAPEAAPEAPAPAPEAAPEAPMANAAPEAAREAPARNAGPEPVEEPTSGAGRGGGAAPVETVGDGAVVGQAYRDGNGGAWAFARKEDGSLSYETRSAPEPSITSFDDRAPAPTAPPDAFGNLNAKSSPTPEQVESILMADAQRRGAKPDCPTCAEAPAAGTKPVTPSDTWQPAGEPATAAGAPPADGAGTGGAPAEAATVASPDGAAPGAPPAEPACATCGPKPPPTPAEIAAARRWADGLAADTPPPSPEAMAALRDLEARSAQSYADVQAGDLEHPFATPERLKLAVEGDADGQRIPLNFTDRAQLDRFQGEVGDAFASEGITDAQMLQLGSGTSGWKGNPDKFSAYIADGGTPEGWAQQGGVWKPTSDVDFAIVSDQTLVQAMDANAAFNAKYGIFRDGSPGQPGFLDTPIGVKLGDIATRWNQEIFGDPNPANGGFAFKLNITPPAAGNLPTIYAGPKAPGGG